MKKSSVDHQSKFERDTELLRKRMWMIDQEKDQAHERLKRKKIEEYERRRQEMLVQEREKLKENKHDNHLKKRSEIISKPRSPSRSRSRSEKSHRRSPIKHRSSWSQIFNGPTEALKMNENELRKVAVTIVRKIPILSAATSEIKRDIVNHEDIILTRRDGEGRKPIFDREELQQQCEVEESRTVAAVDTSNLPKRPKRRSKSLSPRMYRSPSPRAHSSSRSYTHRSRHDEYTRNHSKDRYYKDDKSDSHDFDSKENRRDASRRRRSPRARSYSRERDYHRDGRDHSRSDKERREYRSRSNDRSYDRRDRRDFSEERRVRPPYYFEQMPYPVYCPEFGPPPMLVGPHVPIPLTRPVGRGHPGRRPILPPYPPHFVGPQNVYLPLYRHLPKHDLDDSIE